MHNSSHLPVVDMVSCPTELTTVIHEVNEVVTVTLDNNGVLSVVDELVDI